MIIDWTSLWQRDSRYVLSDQAETLLSWSNPILASKLKFDAKQGVFHYNQDYVPTADVAGLSTSPKFTGTFNVKPEEGSTVTDPVTKTSVTFKPEYRLQEPRQDENRLVYPVMGQNAVKVYSLKSIGMKEDIIVNSYQSDEMSYSYKLELSAGTEARLESNGELAIYGVQPELLGSVSTGTEKDAELLDKARRSAPKKTLLFTFPAPFVKEFGKDTSSATARFELKDNILTLRASGLATASYPISIDPSVYIESAAQLMRGNNETNAAFDVDNELIQKSPTTGARIDAWQGNLDMSEGIWDGGTAAAGGYVYRTGGRTGLSKPQIIGQQTTADSAADTSFDMDMPAVRPAGDLYIALMCHDDAADTIVEPAGWTEYADVGEHSAYYKIGSDAGGGNEAASYTWTVSSGETKAGVIIRVTGFNSADPVSGTPSTGISGGNTPIFPATTPDSGATLVIRAAGADNDTPSDTAWVPDGHTKIASLESGGGAGNRCGFAAASLDTPPSSGVSTGTATFADTQISDTWGASSIAINPAGTTPPPQIEDQAASTQGTDSSSFVMSMPATRPAGDLYIALMCHDGTGTPTAPGGWTAISATDTDEFAGYYKIGTNVSGGNEAASYTWSGITEQWAGVIIRVSDFDSSDIFSGTPGTTNTSGTPGTFPATTPDNNSTLVIRAIGADNDDPPASTAWVPGGHTRIAEGSSSGNASSCGFVSAAMNNAPASGVSTGTVNMASAWLNDEYGGITFAINPEPSGGVTESVRDSVDWAKFNSSTLEIESPNPGQGACSGWCNNTAYNLPDGRRGHTMVAYNGYLYVMGGVDEAGARVSTIYIAKLGANGEPQLWHPTDPDTSDWVYWYTGETLNGPTAKSYSGAVAYNNRMYVIGGQTNASPGGVTTVEMADTLPNGTLGNWTTSGMQALPAGAGTHMQGVHVYNDVIYNIGGFEGAQTSQANLRDNVYYSKLNADGTMNAWQQTTDLNVAKANFGGAFSAIWGAYIYLGGGCTNVNASGYCTTVASDMQLASINADGTLGKWDTMLGLDNTRVGYTFIAWQNGLYRLGGCTDQNTATGVCDSTLADVDYGVINPAGDASTVATSTASGVGACQAPTWSNCDLPSANVGNVLNSAAIVNGYLYIMGGCTNNACTSTSTGVVYTAIDANGSLTRPATCSGAFVTAYCTGTSTLPDSMGAAATTVFNGRIYVVGGFPNLNQISYATVNGDGSLGAWASVSMGGIGATSVSYAFAYARANPSQASTVPGNLFIFGGCNNPAGVGCTTYSENVYKCNIAPAGAPSGCTTSGQLAIGTVSDGSGNTASSEGLGAMAGTVYANYIYLIGGLAPGVTDLKTARYARIDNNNNVVAVSGSAWIESANITLNGRRRGAGFGYNGYLYVVGGYDGTGGGDVLADIEFAKIDVSDGSIGAWVVSEVSINQRWGLTVPVSNSYAYVIGGCTAGAAPSSCSTRTNTNQTFQIYNNNSGTPAGYSAGANLFAGDRLGASATILNGYIYIAGGCTALTSGACSAVTDNVQFAPLDAYGGIGSWADTADATLPAGRAFGQLEAAGGTLYYIGGQNAAGTAQADVYYGTPSSGNVSSWASTTSLPAARTQFGATSWNNRLYVTGGLDAAAADSTTIYASPALSSGGAIPSSWTTTGMTGFNVARSGHTTVAYANNLYVFGGYDGANYLSDSQFTQINADGTLDTWSYTTSLPGPLRDSEGFAVNGYMYLIGGRSDDATCSPKTLVAPMSANTTIATGNNPTGIGDWSETNAKYTGNRYGTAVAYNDGKAYAIGGACPGTVAPAVASITSTNTGTGFATDSTTHNVAMPGTTAAGDLLMLFFSTDDNATVTDPDGAGGWTQQATLDSGAGGVRGSVWAKVATGSDGATVNFATSTSQSAAAQVYRILAADWYGELANGVDVASGSAATTQTPDPPTLNPANWDVENTLWIAYAAGSTYTSITTAPTNYTNSTHHNGNTAASGASVGTARRELSAASDNPGTFNMNASNTSVAFTVAVRPAAFTGVNRVAQTTLLSQPQVAKYSRLIDTDSDVFANAWLMNGLDNSIGARWQVRYRSMNDTDGVAADCGSADMTTWGQETNFGDVTMADVAQYIPKDGSGNNINCARYYYFFISIDASRTFGYPEDVNRGPTIWDLSLFFTSDPNKRLRHGKTFTGGELQPLDTQCRQTNDPQCPLP